MVLVEFVKPVNEKNVEVGQPEKSNRILARIALTFGDTLKSLRASMAFRLSTRPLPAVEDDLDKCVEMVETLRLSRSDYHTAFLDFHLFARANHFTANACAASHRRFCHL